MNPIFRFILLLACTVLTACSGLAGEPRIVRTLAPVTPEAEFPLATPDLALGAQIYAARCTQCHGISGVGDGPLIGTGQLTNAPRSFRDPLTTAGQTPFEWYTTVSEGRIEKLMPPWKDALSVEERWSVAMYTYLLGYDLTAITSGRETITALRLANQVLLSQAESAQRTNDELFAWFEAQNPGKLSGLSKDQREDVTAYLRSLTVANAEVIGAIVPSPVATEEADVQGSALVRGTVRNGSAEGAVPTNLTVTLFSVTESSVSQLGTANSNERGEFQFSNLRFAPGESYVVTVDYLGRPYASEVKNAELSGNELDLPVEIYEVTDDPAVIQITGWVTQIRVVENSLRVAQIISLTNTSDRAYSTDNLLEGDRFASIRIPLPANAQVLSLPEPRYILTENNTAVVDTAPALPDEDHLVQLIYALPYTGELNISHPVLFDLVGPVRILLPPDQLQLVSDQFTSIGSQSLSGEVYAGYELQVGQGTPGELRYTVRGGVDGSAIRSGELIAIGLVLVGAAAITAALVLYARQRRKVTKPISDSMQLADDLVRQIAELDQLQQQSTDYHWQRAQLKSRLAKIMQDTPTTKNSHSH